MIKTITENPGSWPEKGDFILYLDYETGKFINKSFWPQPREEWWLGVGWLHEDDLVKIFTGDLIPVEREDLMVIIALLKGEVPGEMALIKQDEQVAKLKALLEDK